MGWTSFVKGEPMAEERELTREETALMENIDLRAVNAALKEGPNSPDYGAIARAALDHANGRDGAANTPRISTLEDRARDIAAVLEHIQATLDMMLPRPPSPAEVAHWGDGLEAELTHVSHEATEIQERVTCLAEKVGVL